MYEPTDEEADAANIAFHEYAFGTYEPMTRRELGITRQGWKVALIAAHEHRQKEGE